MTRSPPGTRVITLGMVYVLMPPPPSLRGAGTLRRLHSTGALRGVGGGLNIDGSLRKLRSRLDSQSQFVCPHRQDLPELGHDVVDEAVLLRLPRREPAVVQRVGEDPVVRLARVLRDDAEHRVTSVA